MCTADLRFLGLASVPGSSAAAVLLTIGRKDMSAGAPKGTRAAALNGEPQRFEVRDWRVASPGRWSLPPGRRETAPSYTRHP